jgi:hypothetical protein
MEKRVPKGYRKTWEKGQKPEVDLQKWPRCPVCGDYAEFNGITCGRIDCDDKRAIASNERARKR